MGAIKEAMEGIKSLEFPTGELETRIIGILLEYGISNEDEINISRCKDLDREGAKAYIVDFPNREDQSMLVFARSGMDDYVVKILDVYLV